MTLSRSAPLASEALRDRWRTRSAGAGWAYPSDWPGEAVDALCEALVEHRDPWPAAERLGRERAAAAVGLPETLADIDVLVELVPADLAEALRRAVSLGWSEVATAPQVALTDPLTGLVGQGYLQLRLSEIYRAAAVSGVPVPQSHALVMVGVRTGANGLSRRLPMMLAAEVARTVFDGGETIAALSESVLVVLCERTERLPRRAALVGSATTRRIDCDPLAGPAVVRSWVEALPAARALADDLLSDLSR